MKKMKKDSLNDNNDKKDDGNDYGDDHNHWLYEKKIYKNNIECIDRTYLFGDFWLTTLLKMVGT